MQRLPQNLRPTGRALLSSIVMIMLAGEARADCDIPAPEVVWTFPADGQVDVPVNISAVVRSAGRDRLELDGRPVESLPRLAPNSFHELRVFTGSDENEICHQINFLTSSNEAEVPPIPAAVEGHWELTPDEYKIPIWCRRNIFTGSCFDAGEDTHFVLDVNVGGLFTRVRQLNPNGDLISTVLWPNTCGRPQVLGLTGPGPGYCFQVSSVNAAGQESEPQSYCTTTGNLITGSPPVVESDPPRVSECSTPLDPVLSCASSSQPDVFSIVFLLGILFIRFPRKGGHAITDHFSKKMKRHTEEVEFD